MVLWWVLYSYYIKKLGHWEVKKLAQSWTASKWQKPGSEPSSVLKSILLIVVLCAVFLHLKAL